MSRDQHVMRDGDRWVVTDGHHTLDFTDLADALETARTRARLELSSLVFHPDDAAYAGLSQHADTSHRRVVASCYSWPGLHPRRCMELYGAQIEPLLHVVLGIPPDGWDVTSDDHLERSVARAEIRRWMNTSRA